MSRTGKLPHLQAGVDLDARPDALLGQDIHKLSACRQKNKRRRIREEIECSDACWLRGGSPASADRAVLRRWAPAAGIWHCCGQPGCRRQLTVAGLLIKGFFLQPSEQVMGTSVKLCLLAATSYPTPGWRGIALHLCRPRGCTQLNIKFSQRRLSNMMAPQMRWLAVALPCVHSKPALPPHHTLLPCTLPKTKLTNMMAPEMYWPRPGAVYLQQQEQNAHNQTGLGAASWCAAIPQCHMGSTAAPQQHCPGSSFRHLDHYRWCDSSLDPHGSSHA